MKKTGTSILIILTTSIFCFCIQAQERDTDSLKIRRNSLSISFAFFEKYNFNYERNIRQGQISYTNIRIGFGSGAFLNYGDGHYINTSLTHLFGKKSSHLELNMGIKYIVSPHRKLSLNLVPDFFAGYRYEKPYGLFIFRIGLYYPNFINCGIGFKF
jgi:hypothetical protein